MSEPRWMAGPWVMNDDGYIVAPWDEDGFVIIAQTITLNDSADSAAEADANGRLMAAAPDLYDELMRAVRLLETARYHGDRMPTGLLAFMRDARVVLDKARGEQP